MSFRHLVEIGRVAYVESGPAKGKLCTIVDVVDQNKALVDGPRTGVSRQAIPFKQMRLTRFKLKIPHSTSTRFVRKVWDKEQISSKWLETALYKNLESRRRKASLTDYERFRVVKAKQAIRNQVLPQYHKLRANLKKQKKTAAKKA